MSPKRQAKTPPSSRSSSPPAKSRKSDFASSPKANSVRVVADGQPIKLHVVEAKMNSEQLSELYSLVERCGERWSKREEGGRRGLNELMLELCPDARSADILVTAVQMRRRFERHLDWELAKEKVIVTPQWLIDSVEHGTPLPCGDYIALKELQSTTVENDPDAENPGPGRSKLSHTAPASNAGNSNSLSYTSKFACSRASPLLCPNQALVIELDVLRRSRELEGEDISALSYARALAVLKAYPHRITRQELDNEISNLPYIGPKKFSLVEEYIDEGHITETQEILSSTRFQSLSAFTSVYGIGAKTARSLYSLGLRTTEDLERWYEVDGGIESSNHVKEATRQAINTLGEVSPPGLGNISTQVALSLRHELNLKIPRSEVEEIHSVVMAELEQIEKGCISTIVGGYRRGKVESNDVDIVFTHPDPKTGEAKVKGLCKRLVRHLYDRGMVTHVMHLSGFHARNALRTSHRDSVQSALTVFILPPDGDRKRVHRRLDLISAIPKVYWTAVTGWTGSTMFERDLRSWAKTRGLKFDSSGITRRHDSKIFYPMNEREVFEVLGLEWVDPTLRNAGA